jgi:NAD(P)-dependent dehydrogenase (short-subunit alcohol dehydrogenase family)
MSVILVTGCSTGIGQEAALHMARKGHDVYAAVRTPDTATELKEKISAENLSVSLVKLDLTKPDTIEAAVNEVVTKSGRIDALVANAGIGAGSSVEETELDVVREIFETNYFGNVSLFRAVTPHLRQQGSGNIVVVGSLAGRWAAGCHGHYSASKWAIEALCESMAQELAEFGANVSVIEPGCVSTPMWTKFTPTDVPPLYPLNLARLHKGFEFGLNAPAMPSDVAEVIEEAISADKPKFRYPVGKDAVEVTAARESVSENEWVEALCLQGDMFYDRWLELVGVDYYRN